jgi:hypothetical protein
MPLMKFFNAKARSFSFFGPSGLRVKFLPVKTKKFTTENTETTESPPASP